MNTNKIDTSENGGFVRIIVILIIIMVIIGLLGLDAGNIWNNFFSPVFNFIGNLIVSISNFLINLVQYIFASFRRG